MKTGQVPDVGSIRHTWPRRQLNRREIACIARETVNGAAAKRRFATVGWVGLEPTTTGL